MGLQPAQLQGGKEGMCSRAKGQVSRASLASDLPLMPLKQGPAVSYWLACKPGCMCARAAEQLAKHLYRYTPQPLLSASSLTTAPP